MSDIADRLLALEQRVDALESERGDGPAVGDGGSHEPESSETFWALDGLKQRLPAPGGVLFVGAVETTRGPVEWQFGLATDSVMDREWADSASSLAALGNPTRLAILNAVLAGIDSVAALVAHVDVGSTGQAYHHVNQLVANGWLAQSSRGHYVVPAERIVPLMIIITATTRGV